MSGHDKTIVGPAKVATEMKIHPRAGVLAEASRQQWRNFGTSAILSIACFARCESCGVGVHILFYRRQSALRNVEFEQAVWR
jgi:hypothetical protein